MDNATPLQRPKKPISKFFLLANVLLLFIAAIVGAYYLTIYKPTTTKPKAQAVITPTPTIRIGPTTGIPAITPTPTNPSMPVFTPTPTKTAIVTPTRIPTPTLTRTPTPTTPSSASTPVPTATPATILTSTPSPTSASALGPTSTPIPVPCGTKSCDNATNPCRTGYNCVQANDGSNYCTSPEFTNACKANPSFNSCCTAPGAPTATPTEIILAKTTTAPTTTQLLQTGVLKSFLYWVPAIILLVGLIL